jgi:hypothetical protein
MHAYKRAIGLILLAPILLFSSQTIQERVVGIPVGSTVNIKLVDKTRLQGQLLNVSQTGITVRVAEKAAGVQERTLPFGEIKSISAKGNGNTAWKILAGVGIGIAGLIILGVILAAADS